MPRLPLILALLLTTTAAQSQTVSATYYSQIPNANYPDLLYWFIQPQNLAPARYTADIQHIKNDTLFDFPFLTNREGVQFLDNPAAHKAVAGIVAEGHKAGLRVGAALVLQDIDTLRKFSFDENQTVIHEAEGTLDPQGRATLHAEVKVRAAVPRKTELLRVYVFRKTNNGEYDPATLEDVTARVHADPTATPGMDVPVDLGSGYAGMTVFAQVQTWYAALDLMSETYTRWVRDAINQYKDVPLDGTALDEYRYLSLPFNTVFRGHFAGKGFAQKFEAATGEPLVRTLFETRYAPSGHPEVRIRAIDQYWDFVRSGPLRIEQEFYRYSRQIFGPKTFAGIHDTFHNHLTNDEAWATGLNWWTIPREYGQSDEDLSLPMRMGLLAAHPGNIMYDQFYGPDIQRFATKAMNDARFDARLHYHGFNDTGRWGVDLSTRPFLDVINPVLAKTRLLNQFNPAAPELPLLVIFGMPRLLNWFPEPSSRNGYDINDSLHIEEKAQQIWDAGYRCAVVPSDLIDNGSITLDAQNRPTLHGHTFRAVVYLYPEYAKKSTLDFLDRYTKSGGALMLEGIATRDFDGKPIAAEFEALNARARVTGFNVGAIAKLGVEPDPLAKTGGSLEDGSVILTDLPSLQSGKPASFSLQVNGHTYSGSYVGVFAIKASAAGRIEKLACGECQSVARDGEEILHLDHAADLVLLPGIRGSYRALLQGAPNSNQVTVR